MEQSDSEIKKAQISSERPDGKKGMARIVAAAGFSFDGLVAAFKHEDAFRQEVLIGVILLVLAIWLPVPLLGKLWMVSSLFLVLIVELLNSAIEWTVNYISYELHPYAKRAKDMGSAAVFVSLVHVALVWGLVITENWNPVSAAVGL